MKREALRLLRRLTEAHGPPGAEDDVRRIFADEVKENVRCDRVGSIICDTTGGAAAPKVMVEAHMDEVGFVVQSITRDGYIRFSPLGGWWEHSLLSQRLRIRNRDGADIVGVVTAKPPHFLSRAERDKIVPLDRMFIDVGATDANDVGGRFGIRIGDTIVPDSTFTPMHDPDLLLAKAFDDRVGVALVIQLTRLLGGLKHPNRVFSVGTTQEEVGTRGARTAAFKVDPDVAVVLEGTPADDLPGALADEQQGAVGAGVQIRLMDPTALANRPLADFAADLAAANGIPYQIAVRKSGGTNARAIHLHGAGVPTLVLGVPSRYIHTHNSVISITDYLDTLKLLRLLLERLDKKIVAAFTDYR